MQMPREINDCELIITKTDDTKQYVFVGYKYKNSITDINKQMLWNIVTNIDNKKNVTDPDTGVVSRVHVISDTELGQFKLFVKDLFKLEDDDSETLKCALVGDKSFLYMHSQRHRHNFFVVKENGKIAVYYFHSPTTPLPLYYDQKLIGNKMSWTDFVFENYGPFSYQWTGSFMCPEFKISVMPEKAICIWQHLYTGRVDAITKAISDWKQSSTYSQQILPQAVLVFFRNSTDIELEKQIAQLKKEKESLQKQIAQYQPVSRGSRGGSGLRGGNDEDDEEETITEQTQEEKDLDAHFEYIENFGFKAIDQKQQFTEEVHVLKREKKLVDQKFMSTLQAFFGPKIHANGHLRVPFGVDMVGTPEVWNEGVVLGALPCGITKKGKCMFIPTEKFLDILARRGSNPTLPKTNSECTHVCEHWNFEGVKKDTYNFNNNWWKQRITRKSTAELLKISNENYDKFKSNVRVQMAILQSKLDSETESEGDVTSIQETVELDRIQGSAEVNYSTSTATADLFPASDRDIGAIIPVYLTMTTKVAQCDICSGGISEVLNICEAGHHMCKSCLDQWQLTFNRHQHPTCPFCRRNMYPRTVIPRTQNLNIALQNKFFVTIKK